MVKDNIKTFKITDFEKWFIIIHCVIYQKQNTTLNTACKNDLISGKK